MASAPRSLRQVAVPLGAMRGAGQALEFVGFVLLARRLGPTQFGELSVAYLICRYAGLVADWGASLQGTRDVARGRPAGAIHALVRHRTLVTIGLIVVYVPLVCLAGFPGLAPLAVVIAGRGLNRDWLSLGRERGFRSGIPPFLQGAIIAVTVPFVHGLPGASLVIAGAWGIATIVSIMLNRLPIHDGIIDAKDRKVDPWFLILLIADQIYAYSDVVLLAVLASASDAGIYSAVYRFPNAWITVMGLVIVGLLPGITRSLAAEPHKLDFYRRRARSTGMRLALLLICLIPVGWWLVPIVFGPSYTAGRAPLVLLLLATAANTATVGLQPITFAVGNERRLARWASFTALVNIAANLIMIPIFGLVGAASVTLISQLMVSGYYFTTTRRLALASSNSANSDPTEGQELTD